MCQGEKVPAIKVKTTKYFCRNDALQNEITFASNFQQFGKFNLNPRNS
jgi:hypothetical protein